MTISCRINDWVRNSPFFYQYVSWFFKSSHGLKKSSLRGAGNFNPLENVMMEFCRQRSKSRQNQPKCQTPQTFSVCFSIVAFSKFQHSLWKYFPEKSLKSCRLSRMLENWSWPRLVSTCEAPPLGASQAKLLTWKEANCRKRSFFSRTISLFVLQIMNIPLFLGPSQAALRSSGSESRFSNQRTAWNLFTAFYLFSTFLRASLLDCQHWGEDQKFGEVLCVYGCSVWLAGTKSLLAPPPSL